MPDIFYLRAEPFHRSSWVKQYMEEDGIELLQNVRTTEIAKTMVTKCLR